MGSSYLDLGAAFVGTSKEDCFPADSITDKEAFLVSLVVEGGVGGFRPECDFWFRRPPGLGDRNELDAEGTGEGAVGVAAEKG